MHRGEVVSIRQLPLTIESLPLEQILVTWLRGALDEAAFDTLQQVHELLTGAAEPRLVLELGEVSSVSAVAAAALSRSLREAHRVGKEIQFVRCPDWLHRQLLREGTGGTVRHTGSLAAATEGQLDDSHSTWTLSLRSAPEHLRRLREIISILGRGISDEDLQQVKTAVGEACTNAITHGSPLGRRNNVQVSFHLGPRSLIVEVADEGPGFDPEAVPEPNAEDLEEHGYGIYMMRQLMDRLEYFRDGAGTVVRLTKYL